MQIVALPSRDLRDITHEQKPRALDPLCAASSKEFRALGAFSKAQRSELGFLTANSSSWSNLEGGG
jgi:hypothetical protein